MTRSEGPTAEARHQLARQVTMFVRLAAVCRRAEVRLAKDGLRDLAIHQRGMGDAYLNAARACVRQLAQQHKYAWIIGEADGRYEWVRVRVETSQVTGFQVGTSS